VTADQLDELLGLCLASTALCRTTPPAGGSTTTTWLPTRLAVHILHLHHLALILEGFLRVKAVSKRTLSKTALDAIVESWPFPL
jgi:hypothetical protein